MQTRFFFAILGIALAALMPSCGTTDNSSPAGNNCSPTNPNGPCASGQTCINGGCCQATSVCGAACCSAGQSCINGQCCSAPCGSQCCSANAMCVQDSAGNSRCAQLCAKNSDCPSATNCCSDVSGSTNRVCTTYTQGLRCSCQNNSDCTAFGPNTACAPQVNNDIIQSKTLICKPNDAAAWDGCNLGAGACCPTNYDCRGDSNGNHFCARTCSSDPQCGNPNVACCSTTAGCFNCVSACSSGGCMACQ